MYIAPIQGIHSSTVLAYMMLNVIMSE